MNDPTFTFGILTDQIDQDLDRALQTAVNEGFDYISLHRMWGKMITDLTREEFAEVQRLVDRSGLPVNMICSLLFRPFPLEDVELVSMESHPRFLEHMALLDRSIDIAHALDAPYIRTFAFSRDLPVVNPSPRSPDGGGITDETLAKIAKGLRIACEKVAAEGLTLALEDCRAFYANTGGNIRRILDAVDHPDLKVIWDPANAFVAGETPFPDGYLAVRGEIVDVHCKDSALVDAATGLTESVLIGEGGAMWTDQLAALAQDGIHTLTMECKLPNLPHLKSLVQHVSEQRVALPSKG
jgi:sugar phosphate isomerase/epimerase